MDTQEEPQLPGPRRTSSQRPESFHSSNGRYTPQSSISNSSSANLSARNIGRKDGEIITNWSTERIPAQPSSLLQDRLREKKALLHTGRRMSIDVDRAVQSSPVRNGSTNRQATERDQRRPNSSGRGSTPTGKKGMGIKDMEEANNTLHKQNFDLKLELFHRRQKQNSLEEQLVAAEARAAEQAELQAINEQLLAELEKRDQAVEEAVGIICSLEERIDLLIQERNIVQQFDSQYDDGYFRRSTTEATKDSGYPSSPPHHQSMPQTPLNRFKQAHRPVARMPSFLSDNTEGADALRSLYLPSDRDQSIASLPSAPRLENNELEEDVELEGMNSPRLSVLSESSFVSIYGKKTLPVEALYLDAGPASPKGHHRAKSASIETWIEGRDSPEKEAIENRNDSVVRPELATPPRSKQLPSIKAVLDKSPLQRFEKLGYSLNRINATPGVPPMQVQPHLRKFMPFDPRASYQSHPLPPTPDTISTATLYRVSTNTLSQDAQQRPRSAGETITSRREGHGWDTTTASTASTIADDETVMSFDPWLAAAREDSSQTPRPQERDLAREMFDQKRKRLEAPDMFSFSAMEPIFTEDSLGIYNDESPNSWGRDMIFNHDINNNAIDLPSMTRHLQRVGVGEEPRSDDTVIPTRSQRNNNPATFSNQVDCRGDDTPPSSQASGSPLPPKRRSSLSTPVVLRKERRDSSSGTTATGPQIQISLPSHPHPATQAASPTANRATTRARITSKLFGRSESFPSQSQPSTGAQAGTANVPLSSSPAVGSYDTQIRRRQGLPRSQTYADYPSTRPGTTRERSNPYDKLSPSKSGHQKKISIDLESLHTLHSATPPPISRYPRNVKATAVSGVQLGLRSGPRRPSSADNGVAVTSSGPRFGKGPLGTARGRRESSVGAQEFYGNIDRDSNHGVDWGVDGVADERDGREKVMGRDERERRPVTQGVVGLSTSGAGTEASGLKKWFGGLGRNGSVKK